MATTEHIAAALQLAESKKSSLRKALDALKSHASGVSTFNLEWRDLEAHLTSLQNSIEYRLRDLKCKEIHLIQNALPQPQAAPGPNSEEAKIGNSCSDWFKTSVNTLCANMDSRSLILLLNKFAKKQESIRSEVGAALLLAPDGTKLVLGAVEGSMDDKGLERVRSRKSCLLLLEEMVRVFPRIGDEVREEGLRVAQMWRSKLVEGDSNPLEVVFFLQFLVMLKLQSLYGSGEVFFIFQTVMWRKTAKGLCKALGLEDEVIAFINSLIGKEQRIEAIRLIYANGLEHMFQPVDLLKSHLKYARKVAKLAGETKNNSIDAEGTEDDVKLAALKAVVKCIYRYKLEQEYPPNEFKAQIKILKRRAAKRLLTVAAPAVQAQPQQKSGQKKEDPNFIAQALGSKKKANVSPKAQNQQKMGLKRPRNRTPMSSEVAQDAYAGGTAGPILVPLNQGVPCCSAAAGKYNFTDSYGPAGHHSFDPHAIPPPPAPYGLGTSDPLFLEQVHQLDGMAGRGDFDFTGPPRFAGSSGSAPDFYRGGAPDAYFHRSSSSSADAFGKSPPWFHPPQP